MNARHEFLPIIGILALYFFQSLENYAAEPFILGADTSWVQQQEDEGRKFSVGGTNADFYAILRDHGFNWIRLRLFNEPRNKGGYSGKGYCDLPHTIEVAKRVKAAGFKLLLDFHYSDTWADPQKQHLPMAWTNLNDLALVKALGMFTRDSLEAFKAAGAMPEMVQIGNEISNGFLWREGETNHIKDWVVFSYALKAGIAAARAVDPKTKVMLHVDCGGSNGKCRWFFDNLAKRDVKFDVIGLSYYPQWHGTVDNLRSNVTDLATRYPQPVVVVEYSVPTIREVNEAVHAMPGGKGIGTFVWEPTGWPHGDHPALFEKSGAAKPELEIYRKLSSEFFR